MGFHKPNYYKTEFDTLNEIAKASNNLIFGVRGNHDDPSYFDGSFEYTNIKLLPDYSTIKTKNNNNILFIGGGLSIDRINRFEGVSYWKNELPVYDENKLKQISKPSIVVSHAAPAFAYPQTKKGLKNWGKIDPNLYNDNNMERGILTRIFNYLYDNKMIPNMWIYGHYHTSFEEQYYNVKFKALDIFEFYNS